MGGLVLQHPCKQERAERVPDKVASLETPHLQHVHHVCCEFTRTRDVVGEPHRHSRCVDKENRASLAERTHKLLEEKEAHRRADADAVAEDEWGSTSREGARASWPPALQPIVVRIPGAEPVLHAAGPVDAEAERLQGPAAQRRHHEGRHRVGEERPVHCRERVASQPKAPQIFVVALPPRCPSNVVLPLRPRLRRDPLRDLFYQLVELFALGGGQCLWRLGSIKPVRQDPLFHVAPADLRHIPTNLVLPAAPVPRTKLQVLQALQLVFALTPGRRSADHETCQRRRIPSKATQQALDRPRGVLHEQLPAVVALKIYERRRGVSRRKMHLGTVLKAEEVLHRRCAPEPVEDRRGVAAPLGIRSAEAEAHGARSRRCGRPTSEPQAAGSLRRVVRRDPLQRGGRRQRDSELPPATRFEIPRVDPIDIRKHVQKQAFPLAPRFPENGRLVRPLGLQVLLLPTEIQPEDDLQRSPRLENRPSNRMQERLLYSLHNTG
mmetsp:Transcript_125571/g.363335  ORF Transcript_125571/g.363335 Transcript_125571/m.363335 type:complete len:494 (-) Transcript_125571:252-1733(-)